VTATGTVGAGTVRNPITLWVALLVGPTVSALQLTVGYALVKWACAAGGEWVLALLAGVFLALALAGAALAVGHLQTSGERPPGGPPWSTESRQLLATVALAVNLFTVVFIGNALIGIAALSPCE
jgi:hypothetical protein